MVDAIIVSQAALWTVVIILAGVNFLLIRQIGVLFERVAPAGALATNALLEKGTFIDTRSETDIKGQEVVIGGVRSSGKAQLIFFAAPDCPVCKTILPALLSMKKAENNRIDLVIASAGSTRKDHLEFIAEAGLAQLPYIVSDPLGMSMGVAKLPYAVLLASNGEVASFGLVNSREHLESLIEAHDRNVSSLQEYLGRSPVPSSDPLFKTSPEREAS